MAAHSLAKRSVACNFFGSFDWGSCPHCFADVIKDRKSTRLNSSHRP